MLNTPIEVHVLTPDRRDDFLAFFDGEAFADNPKWRFCYCQFLYVDHREVVWAQRSGETNRLAACTRIATGRMQGYLAYRQGIPVGWCNAAPRLLMDAFADEPDPDEARIGQIGCFVVAPGHRRTGVARALLDAACQGLAAQGLAIAEACPVANAKTDAQNHFGPISMFLSAGFTVHRTEDDGKVFVRRSLLNS